MLAMSAMDAATLAAAISFHAAATLHCGAPPRHFADAMPPFSRQLTPDMLRQTSITSLLADVVYYVIIIFHLPLFSFHFQPLCR
jgi:hypothetical protein